MKSTSMGTQPVQCSILICILAFFGGVFSVVGVPIVEKVEPPNWWVGHSYNPVRVLIHGSGLSGARVEFSDSGLKADRFTNNAAGTYLFFDLTIDNRAKPGVHKLKIIAPEGGAVAQFELLKPLAAAGRFQGFSSEDTVYLIMPDRFADGDASNDDPAVSAGLFDRSKPRFYHGGDFEGVIKHLRYLKDLGVTTLWLTPWYDNANQLNVREKYTADNRLDARGNPITDYHGYGAVDFYRVEEHFGNLAKLRQLVDAAHRLGLKVIQDEVANHTGPYHPWVKDSPTSTWYNGTLAEHLNNNWQTWTLTVPDPPAEDRKKTLEGWFINILPDLNQNDPECAKYLIQNTLWWIGRTGIDGIREDTLPYVPRRFWRDWRAAIKAEYPHLNVVGEVFEGDAKKVSFFQGGKARFDGVDSGIESLFDFPLYYSIRKVFIEGKDMKEIKNVLEQDSLYADPNRLVTFLGLHDVSRFMGMTDTNVAGLKLAFTFLLTTRGIPMIYYGDEIGICGGNDPDNRRDFPGGFPDDPRNAFLPAGRSPAEQEIFDHVRKLLHLRTELEPLRKGQVIDLSMTDQSYVYARQTTKGTVLVAINNGIEPVTLVIKNDNLGLREGAKLQSRVGKKEDLHVVQGNIKIELAPHSAAIYSGLKGN